MWKVNSKQEMMIKYKFESDYFRKIKDMVLFSIMIKVNLS